MVNHVQSVLENITFAHLEPEDLDRFSDSNFLKVFRLSQYCIEYLLFTQNYLEGVARFLDQKYKELSEHVGMLDERAHQQHINMRLLKKELGLKKKTLHTYEYLMQQPGVSQVFDCKYCNKKFRTLAFLREHHYKRHQGIEFHEDLYLT